MEEGCCNMKCLCRRTRLQRGLPCYKICSISTCLIQPQDLIDGDYSQTLQSPLLSVPNPANHALLNSSGSEENVGIRLPLFYGLLIISTSVITLIS